MMLVSVMTRRYIYLEICWHDLEPFVFEHSKGLGDHSGSKTSQGNQNELDLIGDLQSFQDSKIPRFQDVKISGYFFLRRCIQRNPRLGINKQRRAFNCVNVEADVTFPMISILLHFERRVFVYQSECLTCLVE